jgi:hypothetical protein
MITTKMSSFSVGCKILTAVVMKSSIFWGITDVFEEHVASIFKIEEQANQEELKMEPTYSSETSDGFQRTTRRYIPQDRTLLLLSLLSYFEKK